MHIKTKKFSRKEKNKRKTFFNELRALEQEYGYRIQIVQSPPSFRLIPIVPPVDKSARKQVEKIMGTYKPWYRKLIDSLKSDAENQDDNQTAQESDQKLGRGKAGVRKTP